MHDRYAGDPLAGFSKRPVLSAAPTVAAERDLVLEHAATGFVGAIVRIESSSVELEDRHGKIRAFPLGGGFLVDGQRVTLGPPAKKMAGPVRTASGSFRVADAAARVALPSRIYVEGRHDAELVERVWGDDLRVEGVVVEYLEGVDDLVGLVAEFGPGKTRRLGVLVDHLVPHSKESRIADAVARGPHGAHVLVVGHPFIDIWQAVKPARLGLREWPVIPRGTEWKHGICEALGWPHADQADIARAWKRILGQVNSYNDLEPVLLGRVEELIDFVTAPG
ncbi:hypothetical protein HD599_001997 [Conyzicola lurida]|uniref:DUF3097 domain-containing protein n=1 Tax=Conyzicola lurida TaxID=1172621 RepID=A0A841AMX0_9MICO|nr:hypothetical protein [Conyzicola lurida]